MRFREDKYFEFIGRTFSEKEGERESEGSLDQKLQRLLEEGGRRTNLWKDNTHLLRHLSQPQGAEEMSVLAETLESWSFRDEVSGGKVWPERYNKLHNYFLLSKADPTQKNLRETEEVWTD